jgi:hypothetical protein
LANEFKVSASYLSQVNLGRRPASKELVEKLRAYYQNSVKQNGLKCTLNALYHVKILTHFTFGGVSELADEHDLGSCAARLGGSSPPFPTRVLSENNRVSHVTALYS